MLLWQKKPIRKKTYPRRNRRSVKRERKAIYPGPENSLAALFYWLEWVCFIPWAVNWWGKVRS